MNCKVHNIRFYDHEVKPIHCLALNKENNWLAVSRKDASIEIWNIKDCPTVIRSIQGTESGSIEAMCWVQNNLLSTGLSGAVVQWDSETLSPTQSILVTGEAAWCIDVNNSGSTIVVGTELGYINLFSMVNKKLTYYKLFDKQEGRILCCKFDPSGQILVTGSIETVRVWNVSSGQALHRMTTGRTQLKNETIVWSLAVTKDLTIISGDSRGQLTFWDAKQGDQIDSIPTHKGDILAIALTDDEQSLYCAGVDPMIVSFMKIKLKHKGDDKPVEKWVKNIQRNIHQHDVRALVLHNNNLYSAGVDSYLAMSSYPPKILVKYPSLISDALVDYCPDEKLIVLRYTSSIELWKLGSPLADKHGKTTYTVHEEDVNDDNEKSNALMNGEKESYFIKPKATSTKRLTLSNGPQKLLKLSTTNSAPLTCCAISPNSRWIAYSTDTKFRIFKFTNENNIPALTKVVPLPDDCNSCYQMVFLPDSKTLLTSSARGDIKILHIHNDGAITAGPEISTSEVLKTRMLTKLMVSKMFSKNLCYIVASDVENNIGIWSFSTKDITSPPIFIASPPKYSSQLTAMCVNHHNKTLFLAYADQRIVEYDLVEKSFTKFSKILNSGGLGNKWYSRQFPITRIDIHPKNTDAYLLHDDTGIYIISKTLSQEKNPPQKKAKNDSNEVNDEKLWYTLKRIRHLVSASWISDNEIAIVAVDPDSLYEKMPPCFSKKRFGVM